MTDQPRTIDLIAGSIIETSPTWSIVLNRNQNLLGKTMLVLQRSCASVLEIQGPEWSELHKQLRRVCGALDVLFQPDLYNYAFLMNRDPQVHLHVVPRYQSSRYWDGCTFTDEHWGNQSGTEQRVLTESQLSVLAEAIRAQLG